jgi:hypothetical protein
MVTTSVCPLIGCDAMPEAVRHTLNHVLEARPHALIDLVDGQRSAAPHELTTPRRGHHGH